MFFLVRYVFAGGPGGKLKKYGLDGWVLEYKEVYWAYSRPLQARVNAASDGIVIELTLSITACTLFLVTCSSELGAQLL
jgi:hypothetical protein